MFPATQNLTSGPDIGGFQGAYTGRPELDG